MPLTTEANDAVAGNIDQLAPLSDTVGRSMLIKVRLGPNKWRAAA
jgi:hypothetical protein